MSAEERDEDARVSYLTVSGGEVARTEDRGAAWVLMDYDDTGECVGVEFLWGLWTLVEGNAVATGSNTKTTFRFRTDSSGIRLDEGEE